MAVLYLLALVFLVKIVLIDSPVGKALGDAIRSLTPQKAPQGAVSQAELELIRRDVEDLKDRVDRVVEEQAFLTQLLSQPQRRSLGPGEVNDQDFPT
jgi:hypothetical protein